MSSIRRQRLQAKHDRLRSRSDLLRERFAARARAFEAPLALADQAREGVHWLRRNPAWPLGAAVALLVVRPRIAWRWAGRALVAWRLWRRLQPLRQGVRPYL